MLGRGLKTSLMLGVAFGGMSFAAPALAQSAAADPGDIIVTARRTEERLQDVPISITVYNNEAIEKRNIVVASDLATYTPSLSVNTRYGAEKASFSLRGFNQDQSTAPTVGVYFADVVGVRAQGGTTSGNSVGAGSFTDLQNVQVLKGPQGTLFGRNTTGGAILLVPAKPTDNLEGYLEGTYGNFDQRRVQAAVNVPLADTFKIRASIDRNERDGYMRNRSGIGPKDYNDTNYFYGRLSIVADLTPELENYTIFHYSRSDTNGYATHYESCDRAASPAAFTRYFTANAACEQVDRQTARGDGPLDVEISNPDPRFLLKTWQVINTTTWQASDNLTVKNIASYGEFTEDSAFNLYSDNFRVPNTPVTQALAAAGTLTIGAPLNYIQLDTQPGFHAAAESTVTEELQLQGRSSDGKFNFVVGGYLEFSRPLGWNQQRTGIYGNCTDPGTLACTGGVPLIPLPAGALFPNSPAMTLPGAIISESRTKLSFDNHGIFAQGTYNFTDQLALTAGGRWTFDKIVGYSESNRYVFGTFPAALGGTTRLFSRVCNDNLNHPTVNLITNGGDVTACGTRITNKSNKPTWLIDLDFKPTPDTLLYAKYSRGYRQGGVNFTNPGLETWKPEKVDTYELGAKLTFRGGVPGYFNIAAFYNDFSNQQVFGALVAKPDSGLAGGAAIINAGKSVIKGVEVDAGATVLDIVRLSAGYTYLDTKIKDLVAPTLTADSPFEQIIPRGNPGDPLTYSPKHRLTTSADVYLPVDETVGELSFGATFTYTSSQLVDGNNRIPSTSLLNLNASWKNVLQSGFDVIGFATNVTNKIYKMTAGGGYESSGIFDFAYGAPRMYGIRLRYNFGK
ncbi:TonB-dependent receptor [Novosphingobium album (ex Liu et al. 2023)]|uniref:TonB-dependent receptor n=1 Tax=Novosphingobium album (ex Liu et al. 2023) TaxID=3031130 RepID=A0ABT5WRQ0_9SPHN|nr:TonB-dependent receptor [Novosphingobium album (ex Liu et al. 2023)]MDE8652712.1 TonB-dependent receptor [Novosphingobium album (ex Liu et al. 2023)]